MADFDNPFDIYTEEDDLLVKELVQPRYRTKKVNLVLISGKLAAGKTKISDYLFHELVNKFPTLSIEQQPLAKPVKQIAYEAFHWDGVKDEKGRRLLQVIGTEAGREYNENIWVEYLENNILGGLFIPHIVLVDDCRFPNEIDYFTKNFLFDVTTIRVKRNVPKILSDAAYNHPSETALPDEVNEHLDYYPVTDYRYNFVVENNGTIEDLYNKLGGIIDHLSNKVITY